MFKVNKKDTRTTPLVSFWCLYMLTLKVRTVLLKFLKKMLAILQYWFAVQHQISTFRRQKVAKNN